MVQKCVDVMALLVSIFFFVYGMRISNMSNKQARTQRDRCENLGHTIPIFVSMQKCVSKMVASI